MENNKQAFSFTNNKNPYEKYLIDKWISVDYRNNAVSGKLIDIDLKFGKGWEYTVEAPTARKLLQSIGRLIQ